jgi:hypothetical protein
MAVADYNPRKINRYVPACQFASDVDTDGQFTVDFGTPAALSATAILSAQSIATAGTTTTLLLDELPAFGRGLQVVASGAATSTVTVKGRDYLGQPMTETLTLNGTTPVLGTKTWKWIDSVTYGATSATTINLGTTNVFGLPYRAVKLVHELKDRVIAANAGTFVGAVFTDPQTATTGATRGSYLPVTVLPDGSKRFQATFLSDNSLNSSGNGGLHGIAQFYA